MIFRSVVPMLAVSLCGLLPLSAAGFTRISFVNPTGGAAYPFGFLQARTWGSLGPLSGWLDYNTDAVTAAVSGTGKLYLAGSMKGHGFAWQNLPYFTGSNGKLIRERAINAQMASLSGAAGYRLGNIRLQAELHREWVRFSDRNADNSANSTLQVSDSFGFLESGISIQSYEIYQTGYLRTGTAWRLAVRNRRTLDPFRHTFDGAFLNSSERGFYAVDARYSHGFWFGPAHFFVQQTYGLQHTGYRQTRDLFSFYATGGPDDELQRAVGYALTEFRTPEFTLTNFNWSIPLSGPLRLALYQDLLVLQPGGASRRFIRGSAVGVLYNTPVWSWFFRLERAANARIQESDRYLVFWSVQRAF